jgi:hypothetical protein
MLLQVSLITLYVALYAGLAYGLWRFCLKL